MGLKIAVVLSLLLAFTVLLDARAVNKKDFLRALFDVVLNEAIRKTCYDRNLYTYKNIWSLPIT